MNFWYVIYENLEKKNIHFIGRSRLAYEFYLVLEIAIAS